jgi:hypothetical protein
MKGSITSYEKKVLLTTFLVGVFVISAVLPVQGLTSAAAVTRITVHPNPAFAGKSVKIVGYNFPVGESVSLKLNSTAIGTATVGSDGEFTFSYTLPASTAIGSYVIYATDTAGDSLSTSLTVTGGIELTPVRAIDGGSVVISGVGLAKSVKTTITFGGETIATPKTTSSGTISYNYTIPMTTLAGNHTFTLTDSKGDDYSATFTTISKLTISPTVGNDSTSIKVTITGFGASLPLTITFGGKSVTSQKIDTNSTGAYTLTFTPLSLSVTSSSNYTVTASDTQGDSSSATFTLS